MIRLTPKRYQIHERFLFKKSKLLQLLKLACNCIEKLFNIGDKLSISSSKLSRSVDKLINNNLSFYHR